MKRIDLFMPPISRYGVLQHFTTDFLAALKRQGIESRLLVAEYDNPSPFLESIFSDPPECTLSFNGLLPDAQGQFFCDMIKIPHVACLVDAPIYFIPLAQSPLNIITCPDRFACEFFRGIHFDNVLFMPHGVDKNLAPDKEQQRPYDVVMLASCIDFEKIRDDWKNSYSKELCAILDHAVEITLSDQTTSYIEAFSQAFDQQMDSKKAVDPKSFNIFSLLTDLELYIRGLDRHKLVTSIKDARVDVFGACGNTKECKLFPKIKQDNIKCHPPIPYEEALDVMKQSKIVLNNCPWIKNGGHERLFAAMACEAMVITNENIFTREEFQEGKNLVTYQHNHWDEVNDKVNSYLANDALRTEIAHNGRTQVMAAHTWDHRAAHLLKELPPILKKIGEHALSM